MKTTRRADQAAKFHAVVKRAYEVTKGKGQISKAEISVYDKLVACPAVVNPAGYGGNAFARPVHAHALWERRAKRLYFRQNGRPIRGFFEDIDWEAIWTWVLENVVPLLKMLLTILPFMI